MKVFSFIGASNTGKSTIFDRLKDNKETLLGKGYIFHEEHARFLASMGHKLDHSIEHATQCAILSFYLKILYESKIYEQGGMVTDRNTLDSFAYSILNFNRGHFTHSEFLEQKRIFEAGIEVSQNVTYVLFPISDHIPLNDDGVRSIDESFRYKVEDTCLFLIEQYKQNCVILKPNRPYLEQVLELIVTEPVSSVQDQTKQE